MQNADRWWAGQAIERTMPVEADTAFAALTDIRELPSWNVRIREVLTEPSTLAAGAAWTVRMQTRRSQWRSRSVVVLHDPEARRFAHHSTVEGGDASYADWRWQVDDHSVGCLVRVAWVLRPVSARQRITVDPQRRFRLRFEVRESLRRLEQVTARLQTPDPVAEPMPEPVPGATFAT